MTYDRYKKRLKSAEDAINLLDFSNKNQMPYSNLMKIVQLHTKSDYIIECDISTIIIDKIAINCNTEEFWNFIFDWIQKSKNIDLCSSITQAIYYRANFNNRSYNNIKKLAWGYHFESRCSFKDDLFPYRMLNSATIFYLINDIDSFYDVISFDILPMVNEKKFGNELANFSKFFEQITFFSNENHKVIIEEMINKINNY